MRARSKTNKVLDIALSEEKFYFPGETIKGSVIVKPKSSMKVNPIIIKFSGAIYLSVKDKEVLPLFQTIKTIPVNEGKSKVLEAKQYSFPFEFIVPNNLPSAMDLGMNKSVRINYKLTVILDKPMVPESLCPKIEYPVLVLEYVDVTKDIFTKSVEKQKEVITANNKKCHAKLSVPRNGFTRGETIPVNVIVNTFESFSEKDSLVIDLIRKVKVQTSRNTLDEESILKSNKFDLNIIGPFNFTQSITNPILVKSTPPTVRYKDRVLRIHYKIRAQVFTENKKTPNLVLELPIIIGTWPRADVPIDDDDDEYIIQTMGEVMIADKNDEDDPLMNQLEEMEFKRHSKNIKRSGSNNSLNSTSSWRSHSTITDPRMSMSPSSTTTISGNFHNNNNIPESYHPRNTLITSGYPAANGYLNRSSSTPDLLSPIQQMSTSTSSTSSSGRTRIIDPTLRTSYYDQGHRTSKSLHSIHPTFISTPQQHRRVGSDEFNFTQAPPPTFNTPVAARPQQIQSNTSSLEDSDSDSDFDQDDEDDDLFSIIERKKKKEEKELRRIQRSMYTVTE